MDITIAELFNWWVNLPWYQAALAPFVAALAVLWCIGIVARVLRAIG